MYDFTDPMRYPAILLALTTISVANADFRVVPGLRVGKVTIGMSTADLMKTLGPTNLGDAAMGKAWATWKGATGTRVDVYSTQQKVVLSRNQQSVSGRERSRAGSFARCFLRLQANRRLRPKRATNAGL
jgi:hypothetical protein